MPNMAICNIIFRALKLYGAAWSGFTADYAYPHPHTLYFLEGGDDSCKLQPEQVRAKMLMFAFGNALACSRKLYGVSFYHKWWLSVCVSSSNGINCHYSMFCRPLLRSDQTTAHLGSAGYSSGSRDERQNISVPGFSAQHNNAWRRWWR